MRKTLCSLPSLVLSLLGLILCTTLGDCVVLCSTCQETDQFFSSFFFFPFIWSIHFRNLNLSYLMIPFKNFCDCRWLMYPCLLSVSWLSALRSASAGGFSVVFFSCLHILALWAQICLITLEELSFNALLIDVAFFTFLCQSLSFIFWRIVHFG